MYTNYNTISLLAKDYDHLNVGDTIQLSKSILIGSERKACNFEGLSITHKGYEFDHVKFEVDYNDWMKRKESPFISMRHAKVLEEYYQHLENNLPAIKFI